MDKETTKTAGKPLFEIQDLVFSYVVDGKEVEVLKHLNFKVEPGEFVGIQGPSGSGKSTLFYILGFLLKPTSGIVRFDGAEITQLSTDELTVTRNQKIGFVFQQFHLLSKANVLENILLPTRYPSELSLRDPKYHDKALAMAEKLGLGNHLHHSPNQLSGGQQQRVAIARALMNDVELILADEPTGNLDSKTAGQILDLLSELNRAGKTIILITHDSEVAKRCSKVYHLRDGAFTAIEENFTPSEETSRLSAGRSRAVPTLPQNYSPALYQKIAKSVFPLVVENLFRNKAKSILTMLGVVIGIAAVLAMVTLGQFTKHRILETYEALGVNKLMIRGYPNWNLKASDRVDVAFRAFDWEKDILSLKKVFPEINYMSPVMSRNNAGATAGGLQIDNKIAIMGVTPEYIGITNRMIDSGRDISPFHVESRSPVCVIGSDISQRLFRDINPLGQILTLTDNQRLTFPCQVIGVLATASSNKEWAPPNLNVLVPYTYFQTVTDSWWTGQIHDVAIQVNATADVEVTGKKIKVLLEQKYGKSGQFSVDSDSTLVAQMKKFLNIFGVLLAAIALLSLVVGGIGINNMMLVSVTERLKEFGIRKALGATHRSIRIQVLLESMALCVAAGVIGVMLGFGSYELLIFAATQFVPTLKFQWVFEPLAAVLSFVSIIAVGMASGFVPALRAEKLEVIEALRSE
jgi:macrolide transport system ATP-binding/permease protein